MELLSILTLKIPKMVQDWPQEAISGNTTNVLVRVMDPDPGFLLIYNSEEKSNKELFR